MKLFPSENYSIEIGPIIESTFSDLLFNKYSDSKVIIIVDENTHDHCLEYMLTSFESLKDSEIMLLPAGEENKVMEVCFQVWQALSEYKIGRKDLIINLGGGVVTDMGGFIASVFKRGIDFIHIPTSLLGMVDASIGGKTGIDLGPYKNQLGVFSFPKVIYVDPIFLGSLPNEEVLFGFAEMLKHALISSREKWEELKNISTIEDIVNIQLIIDSIKVKFEIVESDPFEKDKRKSLNFGHTIGHAIEGFLLDKEPIGHGHAVAIGMIAESYISMKMGKLNKTDYYDIELILTEKFPMINLDELAIKEIVLLARNDKKNETNKIKCVLLNKIGEADGTNTISGNDIAEALFYMNKFSVPLN